MNPIDLYSTRIQKTFDEDHNEILGILKANPKANLKLINYYKGLPLSYNATIAGLDRGVLDLDVQPEQAFTIEHERYAFIRSPLFRFDLFAQAQYVNVRKHAASFVKFCYVEIMAERRNFLRLELDKALDAKIFANETSCSGKLHDISLSGLNIMLDDFSSIGKEAEASVSFRLTDLECNTPIDVNLPSRLVTISDDTRPYSYRFSISPDRYSERTISRYIFQRQIEIIREIKDAVI